MSYSVLIVNSKEKENKFLLHYLERGMLAPMNQEYIIGLRSRVEKYQYEKVKIDGEYEDYKRNTAGGEIKLHIHNTHVIVATDATNKDCIFDVLQDASEFCDSDSVALYIVSENKWGGG